MRTPRPAHLAAIGALAVLSACTNLGAPIGFGIQSVVLGGPDLRLESSMSVSETSVPVLPPSRSLAVLVGSIAVSDSMRAELDLADHDGWFVDRFVQQMASSFESVEIGREEPGVRGFDAEALGMSADRPADGDRFDFPGFEADYVLVVDGGRVYHMPFEDERGTGFDMRDPFGGIAREPQTLWRLDSNVLLWDNAAGELIATGWIHGGTLDGDWGDLFESFAREVDEHTPIGVRGL